MAIPTEQQMRFYNLMSGNERIGKNSSGNFALDAVAGSGKTTSAVKGAECAKKRFRKIGFTAFNKTIADELQKRLGDNASASTLHALGRSILLSRFPFWELDKLKYNKLVKQNYPSFFKSTKGFGLLKPEFGSIFAVIDVVRSQNVDFSKLTGDTVSEISELCDRQGIELPSKDFIYELLGAAVRVCEIGSDPTVNTSFDFTDMVWLPNVIDIGKNMFDLLMADEAQDFNPIQQQLVYRVSEKVVIIGDPCQPPDTLVKVFKEKGNRWNGGVVTEDVRIIDLSVGDRVYSYCAKDGHFYSSKKVTGKTVRHYEGDMVVCKTDNGRESRYTTNHICIASFNSFRGKYCCYLMSKDGQFRVGISKFSVQGNKGSGPVTRLKQEGGDRLWILKIFDTKEEAHVFEQSVSGKFGIPQLVFSDKPLKNKSLVKMAWDFIGDNSKRGEECLEFFGRQVEYPLIINKYDSTQSLKRFFQIRACNLIDGCLVLEYKGRPNSNKKEDWVRASITREHYCGEVVSLDVEDYHTYVADGIVTHNCQSIMGWAGADTNSFRNMVDELNATKLPLSVCWRCPKSHLELAKILVPHIQASPSAGDGLVEEIDPYQIPRVLKPGDMGICRNNAPLVSAAYRFMKDRVPVIVRGKDIGDSILSLIDKLDPLDLTDLSVRLKRWEERECKKLVDREADESAFESLRDRVDCVRELAGETDTLGDFRVLVSELFSNKEDKDCVILSSVHRSKGLEAENIAILNSDLLCKRAKDSEAYKQEKNLAYVALTRAKSKLLISGLGCSSPTEWVERMASGASQFIFGRRRSNV